MRDRADRRPAVDGALAGAVALALLWAVASVDPRATFPALAIGDRLIRLTPGSISAFLIEQLQHDAQRLAAAGSTLLLIVIGAALGRWTRPLRASLVFGVTIAVAGLLNPVGARVLWSMVAGLAGGAAYAATSTVLRRAREPRLPIAGHAATATLSRRQALAAAAGALGALLGAGTVLRGVAGPGVTAELARVVRQRRVRQSPFAAISGLSKQVTPVADHYVVDIDLSDPLLEARHWTLRVDGLVGAPLALGFDELQRRFPLVEEASVLTCVSNDVGGPLVGCSRWLGVPLREVLRAAGPSPRASGLAFHCADGYSVGIPMWAALHPGTLVAVGQNGKALTREHGFHCRIRVPAMYGMMNAKWVERIEVVDHRFLGYWQRQGWAPDAEVRTQSRIDVIEPRRVGETGWIAGVAWAGIRGVDAVEVLVDGGRSWRLAELPEALSPWAWRQWALRWTPTTAGRFEVVARARDGLGAIQDRASRDPRPAGATGYHRRTVTIT